MKSTTTDPTCENCGEDLDQERVNPGDTACSQQCAVELAERRMNYDRFVPRVIAF